MELEIAETWFECIAVDATVTMLTEPHVDPLMRSNIWHVRGRDRDLLVDAGMGIASLKTAAPDLFDHEATGRDLVVVATHAHWDHAGGLHEFGACLAHEAEADILRRGDAAATLLRAGMHPAFVAGIEASGCPVPDLLVTALPHAEYDTGSYRVKPVEDVTTVAEGDVVDLGDRVFEVLHLPGHSPGGIGLWDARSGTLFAGDTLYDAELLDTIPGADTADYSDSLSRLRDLPVRIVHAGHEPSFGAEMFSALIDDNLARWAAG